MPFVAKNQKVFLTEEDEKQLVREYLDGAPVRATCKRVGIGTERFYRLLRRHGVEPVQHKWLRADKHPKCVVCGDPIGGWGKPIPQGQAYYALTCKDPMCRVDVDLRPWLVPEERRAAYMKHFKNRPEAASVWRRRIEWRKRLTQTSRPVFVNSREAAAAIAKVAPDIKLPWLKYFELSKDRRGSVRTAAHEATWSDFSRVTAFARFTSREGATALKVTLEGKETPLEGFARTYLGSLDNELLTSILDYFDVFLAWRCECPQATQYELRSLHEFPRIPGTFGLCELCGAAAIEIGEKNQ